MYIVYIYQNKLQLIVFIPRLPTYILFFIFSII